MKKIRVLVVDDSAMARKILSEGLAEDPRIEVVGTAHDAYEARDLIVYKEPDVMTLDIEMPRMDGLEFLKKLMPQYPMRVIIVSALSHEGAAVTLEALEAGAVDFVLKPSSSFGIGLKHMLKDLSEKIRYAAGVSVDQRLSLKPALNREHSGVLAKSTDKVLAVGASTGGTTALSKLIEAFPPDMPGCVVVQHMPPMFTDLFAQRLNSLTPLEVREARSGDRVVRGRVLIAPGGKHMTIKRSGGQYLVRCFAGEKVHGQMPSVSVLFDSVAKEVGPNAVGVMLTGMGDDGADEMVKMREAGARTLAQDESSSIVFGMPAEAYKRGGAEELVPLDKIPGVILERFRVMAR